ncbi:DNA phosphorothioation-associated putative methyltransferase [Nitrincola nitratireducens]|uniref:DNA phosphorothioation-associated putative methyltransferase n=1 Tax=Nitrincola nitratireducens TaxID=1229521 RepID=W9UWG8_9GAMM|nr:DNA phosphorothioation-associated putative methyltransferase [Nitrincola nitratireducens]EXJ11399.1 DNA phosphorothioation-associated putative methyltransferase [Nitrincola nitratireducens]
MDAKLFQELVKALKIGKTLPDATYLHKTALEKASCELFTLCSNVARALKVDTTEWDLVKLFRKEFKVAFLSYPDFYNESYPSLKQSILVDLSKLTSKITSYKDSDNPPILHRKELMVSVDDPLREHFESLTKEGELAGLYANPFKIGFKQTWERLIEQKGYNLKDGRIIKVNGDIARGNSYDELKVDRHLTAIIRYELSTPFKLLAKHNFLTGDYTIFDYGCGRGDDLRELEAHSLSATGWDPNFRPDAELVEADIVNIGFVINVIEDIDERIEALQRAYSLAKKFTVVSAMVAGESVISKFQPYRDGVLTSRNTFQKYYTQGELKVFIERTLDTDCLAIGPGVFLVFKDKLEEQNFLLNRNQRTHHWNHLTSDEKRGGSHELVFVKYRELLEQLWNKCLILGRLPASDEFDQFDALEEKVGSPKKALQIINSVSDILELEVAAKNRTEDLVVYFALNLFSGRPKFATMPERLKRDIKAFFGTYQSAIQTATEALFAISDTDLISESCLLAHSQLPSSDYRPNKHLIFHEKYLEKLPYSLRIYVGCAAQLFGELDDIQLIKIHIHTGKVSFLGYEGFEDTPLPLLKERVKVKLREQDVDYFDYVEPYNPPLLYWKSKFIDESFSDFKKQVSFDKRLAKTGIIEPSKDYGPKRIELDSLLKDQGLEVRGYRFYSI